MEKTETKQKPEASFQAGIVKASVWNNVVTLPSGDTFDSKNVQLQKSWKDKKGEWQSASVSLAVNDIPRAVMMLEQAYAWCITKQKEDKDD